VRDESLASALRHLAYTDNDRQAAIEALPIAKEEKKYLRRLQHRDDQH
jgi:nuclear transport factor 2 (NTF2) superfamily protein